MRQLKISSKITSRDADSINVYLNEVSKLPMINPKEEIELTKRIKKGDEQALETLVRANLRFVISVAKQYQNQGFTLGDLVNEGNLGLMKAAKRFDETKGFKFISYAVFWIRQSILQALAENGRIIRLPTHRITSISKIYKSFADLEQQYEREPTTEEITTILDITQEDVELTIRSDKKHLSIDYLADPNSSTNDDFMPIQERLVNEDVTDGELMKESLKFNVARLLKGLSYRESETLKLYFGLGDEEPKTLEQIGVIFELSKERMRQLKESALFNLRKVAANDRLKNFFD